MLTFSILLGKLSSFLIKLLTKRSASTWPGHLVIESNPNFIRSVMKRNSGLEIILVAGTNGKTTTTKALHHILESKNIPSARNTSGANLLNGFTSLLLSEVNLSGRIEKKVLLFEVDENSLPLLLKELTASNSKFSIILLNLFRDQLDRYGEVNTTAEKWKEALSKTGNRNVIIANSDDPQIAYITKGLNDVFYYSIPDSLKKERTLSHAVDSATCPNCRNALSYSKIAYSHLGNYTCTKCKFTNPKSKTHEVKSNLEGTFNKYNLSAAVLTALKVFNINTGEAEKALFTFKPAFGRQESLTFKGRKIKILLSKNPTGFNESLKMVLENNYKNLIVLLNDRIPDGRDISWIWDVDFEILSDKEIDIVVSGDRTYDLANRLEYSQIKFIAIENLESALNEAVKKTGDNSTLAVLATYSAMLDVRKIVTGKSIL